VSIEQTVHVRTRQRMQASYCPSQDLRTLQTPSAVWLIHCCTVNSSKHKTRASTYSGHY